MSNDWQQRYRAHRVIWTSIAEQNEARGLACGNRSGAYQLYAWDTDTNELRQLTDRPEGVIGGNISPSGGHVYFFRDEQGNEIGHYVRVPYSGGEPEDLTPDMPPYASWSLGISRANNGLGFVAADQGGFTLYTGELTADSAPGPFQSICSSQDLMLGPSLSFDGKLAVVQRTQTPGKLEFKLLAYDTATGEQIAELSDGEDSSVEASRFSPVEGDYRLLATTNRTGVVRPFIWNPRTGERQELELDVEGEVHPYDWSDDGGRLLLSGISQAVQRLYVYDLESRETRRLDHPGGTFGSAYFAPNGQIYANWEDSTHPSQVVALDGETGELVGTILAAGEVPRSRPWRSVTYTSGNGDEIQGWLATPEGEGPFPTILETHGGPTAVQPETFSPGAQAWLDRGFAFMTINYHGSTTFGKEFEESIWGRLGELETQDIVAAREWLIEQGITRPDQVFLTGWSYGGFLTLYPLGTEPDLWAGGMAGIAIADWRGLYEDSSEVLRAYLRGIMLGTPEERPEEYKRSSPVTYAEDVQVPLLIIQGRNDTRTPARQMEEYVQKLRALGKEVRIHWFDTGHLGTFADVELGIRHQEMMMDFAQGVLGGEPAAAS